MNIPPPRPAPLIRLAQINLQRGRKTILEDVDLTVHAAEIVTLIGPNGAGKTTLVNIALNLLAPDRGAVERRACLTIGYVPQRIEFDETLPLTVRRFLQLEPGRAARAPNLFADDSAPTDAIAQLLAYVGAGRLRDSPLQALSGGELRRVLLARALARDPDLLILDEPGAGMDIHGQAELYRLIHTIRDRRRCGVFLVSHDLHMVMAATDRVICLNRHVCCSGAPRDVRRHPEFLALFGAPLAAELAIYQHQHDHEHELHGEIKSSARPAS